MNTQIKNIEHMERVLNTLSTVVDALQKSVSDAENSLGDFHKLMNYYSSEHWLNDLNSYNSGNLPKDLKCGVLSEDSVYNLYGDYRELALRIIRLGAGILDNA